MVAYASCQHSEHTSPCPSATFYCSSCTAELLPAPQLLRAPPPPAAVLRSPRRGPHTPFRGAAPTEGPAPPPHATSTPRPPPAASAPRHRAAPGARPSGLRLPAGREPNHGPSAASHLCEEPEGARPEAAEAGAGPAGRRPRRRGAQRGARRPSSPPQPPGARHRPPAAPPSSARPRGQRWEAESSEGRRAGEEPQRREQEGLRPPLWAGGGLPSGAMVGSSPLTSSGYRQQLWLYAVKSYICVKFPNMPVHMHSLSPLWD